MQKILPSPLVLLTFLLGFITAYYLHLPIFNDPDIGWHIAAGDIIRKLGDLPVHDVWSFTEKNQTWYNISWAWDVLLSFINQHIGIDGLFIFAKICPAIVVASLIYFLKKRGNIGINAIILTGFITFLCLMEFAYARPQIIGLFLLLIFHHLLHQSRLIAINE